MKRLLASILLTLGVRAASAAEITGIPVNGLAAAVAAAQAGDVLILDAAEYTFDGTLVVDKAITLRGAGAGLTILKGSSGTTRHVSVNHAGAVIEGVTFQGKTVGNHSMTGFGVQIGANGGTVRASRVTGFLAGNYYQTGAVELNSDAAVLEDCVVDGNNASYNNDAMCWCGGVYLQKGVVRGCRILANQAHQASGLYIKGGTADGCLIAGNVLYYPDRGTKVLGTGAGVYASGGLVTNCLIRGNLSYQGGGAAVQPNGFLRNCTVVDNRVITDLEKRQNFGYGGGIYLLGGRVENTVFWGNTSERAGYTGDPEWYGATKTVFLKCALPAGVTTNATTGSDFLMLADPRFRDAAGGDFQIRGASPLVNAGANQNIAAEDLDLDRQPRIFNFGGRNGLVDIGCYESQVRAGILFLVR